MVGKLRAVDTRPLKRLASERLASDSLLRRVLLAEPDSMSAVEFVAKLGTWLVMLREESLA